ncbi:MAG: hypothetical protein U1F36_15720 [Planctomycetota bacterium]
MEAPLDKLLDRLFASLDWHLLGSVYCDTGGDAFWEEHRKPALRQGRRWAEALAERLPQGGTSLYVGAGVAELPAMLREVRSLGRRVLAGNLRVEECSILDAGLRAVGVAPNELTILPVDARSLCAQGPFDHLSLVSILSDPERWPVSSAVGYGRMPPVLLDVDTFVRERGEILALASDLVAALRTPAWITTTAEEVPWLMHVAEVSGRSLESDDEMIETAIVGDPIGFLRLA